MILLFNSFVHEEYKLYISTEQNIYKNSYV